MISQIKVTLFSRNLLISAGLVVLLVVTFALYVASRERVARAFEQRHRSFLLADELRQSGDDLTRMVRTYVATEDPAYKTYFQDILDIRDGRKPRPEHYWRTYWILKLPDGPAPRPASAQSVPLLDLMRQAGFTKEEFHKLAEAKANSDALTQPEFEAMKLVEAAGPEAEANRARAIRMLFDEKYHQAKFSVMKPIDDFLVLVDQRTLAAVHSAEIHARTLRYVFIALGLGLMFMLWRTYAALNDTLGGSVNEVYARIAKIGSGDFSAAIPVKAGRENSVMGWLAETQAKLNDIERERQQSEAALKSLEWMLTPRPVTAATGATERVGQAYGDVTELNTERTILDAVGKDLLNDIVGDYMNLLETSSAVYEKNGDYAFGIFTSGWCQAMDMASFRGCGTSDNREALRCGKWHCHESCWNDASRKSMETRGPTDIECAGGIRLHAVPIYAGDEIVGSINFGYGDPPRDPARLQALSAKYGLPVEELKRNAAAYERRPPFIIELAKERLLGSARLIGEIVQRKRAEAEIRQLNVSLGQRVRQRTVELEEAVKELESFSYSVSHDLRAPLRAVAGFGRVLQEEHASQLEAEGRRALGLMVSEARRMGQLIDELLAFSRLGRHDLRKEKISPPALVSRALEQLRAEQAGRDVELSVGELMPCHGDPALLQQVWINLLSNALKYTRRQPKPRITIGSRAESGGAVYFVQDNGVGFDMQYAGKLFGVFQRLHSEAEFEGTGVGLALAQRIVHRHGGRIWAEAKLNEGATFYFSVPNTDTKA